MGKRWWKSKTFWLNVATGGIALALEQDSPEQLTQILAAANLVLRFFTSQPRRGGARRPCDFAPSPGVAR